MNEKEFLKIGNNNYYYIDFEEAYKAIRPSFTTTTPKVNQEEDEPPKGEEEINEPVGVTEPEDGSVDLFKMEIVKISLERIVLSQQDNDESILGLEKANLGVGFKIAFNTLLKYNILKEIYE